MKYQNKKKNFKENTKRNTRNPKSQMANDKKKEAMYENDFSWYNHNPALLESACRIPFAKPTGEAINAVDVYDAATKVVTTLKARQPGVFTIVYDPSIGYSVDANSPATIAAREVYAKVRKAYSGTLTCDPPDFMMYMLALDGIFSYLAFLKRIYRTINVYSGVNKYLPDVLLRSMNLSDKAINELRANKTKFWGEINVLISNASKFTCPAVMDIFNRHYWMNDSVFADRANLKGQFYVFRQRKYWRFKLDNESRGMVEAVYPGEFTSMDALIKFGNSMLSALNDDEDAYTINGYLLRAFEGVPNFKVAPLEENEVMTAIYSPEVLLQIHNSKITGFGHDFSTNVTQDGLTSVVYSKQEFTPTTGTVNYLYNYLLDSPVEMPSGPEVVIASRLMPAYKMVDGIVRCYSGTEIPLFYQIYSLDSNGAIATTVINGSYLKLGKENALTTASMAYSIFKAYFHWSNFNDAPIYSLPVMDDQNVAKEGLFLGETTNLTSVDTDTMVDLNRMCIYSEFNAFGINT